MTDNTSLVNLALQSFGNRTVITTAQLLAGSNNEAKQANLTFTNTRDSLLRLAPWDCGLKTANLAYITSAPGTPENTSPATNLWQPGQPRPPWAYEYQYPADCLRACWIIPATQTGYAGGIPITTAVTGGASTLWNGGAIRFKVGLDQFAYVQTVDLVTPGTGYVIGDFIELASGNVQGQPPLGAPMRLLVTNVIAGAITSYDFISQVPDTFPPFAGSYFPKNPPQLAIPQASTTGVGSGATFNITLSRSIGNQRVILTNQEFATLVYVCQVTDPNVWDPMFQDAFINALGGDLCMALTGDKALAKMCYAKANQSIEMARTADGNEGLSINDVTPDWIRTRGFCWADGMVSGPYSGFDWGTVGYGF